VNWNRYFPAGGAKVYESRFLLPRGLTCTQCVMQWRYIAGNNWGQCENGSQAIGCGPQEEFRACADVSIQDSTGHAASGEDETVDDNEIDIRELSFKNSHWPPNWSSKSLFPTLSVFLMIMEDSQSSLISV